MPLVNTIHSRGRVTFSKSLTASEINSLVSDQSLEIFQTDSNVEFSTWHLLNEHLFSLRPEIQLRLYGFYSSTCDLSLLPEMRNVRHFLVEDLQRAQGLEHLAALQSLESLSIGIYHLDSFDFLSDLDCRKLTKLSLGRTKSKKPCLERVSRFEHLRVLCIVGQQNGIEAISRLYRLEDINLVSITVDDLDFLKTLGHLWSLRILFGGTRNLSALAGMNGIKYLKLMRIRGLENISVISTMRGLQYLHLEDIPHIDKIPDLSTSQYLRRIRLVNARGLTDLAALLNASQLEELCLGLVGRIDIADYLCFIKSSKLKRLGVGTGSMRRNKVIKEAMKEAGIQSYQELGFKFQ